MALLDGRLDSYEWSPEIIQRLKKWIIIGAGTWQGLVKNESMGFLPKQNSAESKIRDQADIPEELLARFNSCWLYVAPPSRVDIRNALIRIHNEMNRMIPLEIRVSNSSFVNNWAMMVVIRPRFAFRFPFEEIPSDA